MNQLILASASPRRAQLLKQINLDFVIKASNFVEGTPILPPREWVEYLALAKAREVAENNSGVILAADTIVVNNNKILGKPSDKKDASQMLFELSGSSHEVITGVAVLDTKLNKEWVIHEITKVYFRNLTEKEIANYVNSGEPMDKAGAYGIQGLGALLVEHINGCYYNVVGLPLVKTMNLLRQAGLSILEG